MFSQRAFKIAFLVSLITHTVILFQNANLNLFTDSKKEQKIEISYIKEPDKPKEHLASSPLKREPFLESPTKTVAKRNIAPPFIDKENIFRKDNIDNLSRFTFTKPTVVKPDTIALKKKVSIPAINMDKINNHPSYISYYQIVREKIKRATYQNYIRPETGEVNLSFIISGDGYLKEVKLIEEKSSPSSYLREIAQESVKNASPFPNFPKELDYPRLSFNVVISFEVE